MEPYMEPLGDRNSFGFRPGKNSLQAISYLYNKLTKKKRKIYKNKTILSKVKFRLNLKTRKIKNIKKYENIQTLLYKIIKKN
jgi:retron-type reverse transcriptase